MRKNTVNFTILAHFAGSARLATSLSNTSKKIKKKLISRRDIPTRVWAQKSSRFSSQKWWTRSRENASVSDSTWSLTTASTITEIRTDLTIKKRAGWRDFFNLQKEKDAKRWNILFFDALWASLCSSHFFKCILRSGMQCTNVPRNASTMMIYTSKPSKKNNRNNPKT